MAKKNGVMDGLMDLLGEEGGQILEDVLEGVLGQDISSSGAETLLENVLEGGGDILQNIGEAITDLTGIGSPNTKASETASMTGVKKSSSSAKKVVKKPASGKTRPEGKTSSGKTSAGKTKTASSGKSSASKKKIVR